jgi:hypothetical protein
VAGQPWYKDLSGCFISGTEFIGGSTIVAHDLGHLRLLFRRVSHTDYSRQKAISVKTPEIQRIFYRSL